MKNVPNIISTLRILLSIGLLFSKPFSPLFWILYSVCGFSDIIDGYIARKSNSISRLGSLLDSIGDIVFISAVIIVLIPVISIPKGIQLWIAIIALVRILSITIACCKYHTFAVLHTYANKISGLLLFFIPYLYSLMNINILGGIICAVTSISAVEELIIHLVSRELSRDVKGLFDLKKAAVTKDKINNPDIGD